MFNKNIIFYIVSNKQNAFINGLIILGISDSPFLFSIYIGPYKARCINQVSPEIRGVEDGQGGHNQFLPADGMLMTQLPVLL